MSRPGSDSDDDRALFEAALAELERGDPRRVLLEKAGLEKARLEKASSSEGRSPGSPDVGRAMSRRRLPRLGRRLRAGEDVSLRIDLHGMDRAAALAAVERFVRELPPGALALVIHGRGRGILARAVLEALDRASRVAEHVPAPKRLGGAGARVLRVRS